MYSDLLFVSLNIKRNLSVANLTLSPMQWNNYTKMQFTASSLILLSKEKLLLYEAYICKMLLFAMSVMLKVQYRTMPLL